MQKYEKHNTFYCLHIINNHQVYEVYGYYILKEKQNNLKYKFEIWNYLRWNNIKRRYFFGLQKVAFYYHGVELFDKMNANQTK